MIPLASWVDGASQIDWGLAWTIAAGIAIAAGLGCLLVCVSAVIVLFLDF
jgi:hypothetical protein